MRVLLLFFFAVLVLTIQTTAYGILGFRFPIPDLSLIYLVIVSLRFGPVTGVWCGLLLGIAHDVYAADHMGASALAMAVVGYLVGLAEEQMLRLDFITKVILLAIAFVIQDLLSLLILGFDGATIRELFWSRSLPQGLYTVALGSLWFYFSNRRHPLG